MQGVHGLGCIECRGAEGVGQKCRDAGLMSAGGSESAGSRGCRGHKGAGLSCKGCRGAGLLSAGRSESAEFRDAESAGVLEVHRVQGTELQGCRADEYRGSESAGGSRAQG